MDIGAMLIVVSALVAFALVLAHAPLVLRVPAGLVLTLLLPGTAFCRRWLGATVGDHFLAGLAVSLVFDVLVGLVLDATRVGIGERSLASALTVLTVTMTVFGPPPCGIVAALARPQLPRFRLTPGLALACVTCAACVAGGSIVARSAALEGSQSMRFTQLAVTRESGSAVVDVTNHEHTHTRMRLLVTEGSHTVAEVTKSDFLPGQHWQVRLPLASILQDASILTTVLYRAGSRTPYRRVMLWLGRPVSSPSPTQPTRPATPDRPVGPLMRIAMRRVTARRIVVTVANGSHSTAVFRLAVTAGHRALGRPIVHTLRAGARWIVPFQFHRTPRRPTSVVARLYSLRATYPYKRRSLRISGARARHGRLP